MKKGIVVWNDDKIKVGQLIKLGKSDDDIVKESGCSKSMVKAVRGALTKGQELLLLVL